MNHEIVAVNGEIFEPSKARISVFDRGFLYGDGVYEVARSYDRVYLALEDHVDRLFNSACRIELKISKSPQEIISEIYRVSAKSDVREAYMRIVVTRGEGPISLDPTRATGPNIVIFVKELEKPNPSLYEKGMDIVSSTVLRNTKRSLDPNIKSGNYLNNVMALGEAKGKMVDDAVMVNRDGHVAEGTTWNIFMVKDGTVVSPPDEADILHGITRKIIKRLCSENSIPWVERYFSVEALKTADEVFSSGTVKEIMAIRSVDGAIIGRGGPGELTKKISNLYKNYITEYCKKAMRG